MSSHSIVSSSRTVRPCSPWGYRCIGHWRATWSTFCSSAPHSQAVQKAMPHLYKLQRKRATPVRRRLSGTKALRGRVIPEGWCRCRGWKRRVFWGYPSTLHSIGNPPTAPHACRCCQIKWWDVVRRVQMGVSIWGATRLHSIGGWALSGACPGSMARRARESVVPLQRSSAGSMPAMVRRLSAGARRRHQVTICKVSLMAGSMRRYEHCCTKQVLCGWVHQG